MWSVAMRERALAAGDADAPVLPRKVSKSSQPLPSSLAFAFGTKKIQRVLFERGVVTSPGLGV
jgi:hypothetical protein